MTREADVVRSLVEMADTLVDDYDVVDLLTGLANRCVTLLDVSAVGVMRQLRIAQAVTFRDLLREDPTLALAHLLLESPETVTGQAAISTISAIGEQVAAYAPGAAWVKTAQLLEKSFGELPPDAKQFIIDRICSGLMEFKGAEDAASRIRQVHGIPAQHAAPNGRANDNDSRSLPTQ